MSARHQLRFGRRLGRDRAPIDATPAPPVGETLQSARERKGVDLYRAERDTRIRLRYLAALEDGDWDDLPAPVYVKGFLRNYAIYLGLEADDILERWRDEMEQMRTATRVAVAPPPMPIVEPGGRRFTITPTMIVAGVVALAILAFVGYIGVQLLRFSQVVPVGLTYPVDRVATINEERVTIEGTAGPGARINISGSGDQVYATNADEEGGWSQEVELARGENRFRVIATDPVTNRPSDPYGFTIIRPLPTASPTATGTFTPPPPITLSIAAPATGFVTTEPSVTFSGTTTGTRITITSVYLGEPGSTPAPSPLPTPSAAASQMSSPSLPPAGPSADVTLTTGSFSEALVFPAGHWRVTLTSFASGLSPIAREIDLTVMQGAPTSLQLSIQVIGRQSWLRVFADGERVHAGTVRRGEVVEATATTEFCIRAGNAGALTLSVNGEPLGILGRNGEVGTWVLTAGSEPVASPGAC
jgi:cytoskeletal protein RodZ